MQEFLSRPGRIPLDFAVCAILSKDGSLLDKARELDPNNAQIHFLSLNFDKKYLDDPLRIQEFVDLHPDSAWPILLQSSAALSRGDDTQALEYLTKTQNKHSLEGNEVALKKSTTDFLVEMRNMDLKSARLTSVADIDNSFSTFRVCDDLASSLSERALTLLQLNPDKALPLAEAAYSIREQTTIWQYAHQSWQSLIKLNSLVAEVGFDRMAQYTGERVDELKERLVLSEQEAREKFVLINEFKNTASTKDLLNFESIADEKGEIAAWKLINEESK